MDDKTTYTLVEYIINTLSSIPVGFQITILILIFPLMFLLYKIATNKDFRLDIKNLLLSIKSDKLVLSRHDLFINERILSGYIDNINFNSSIKDDIFRMILKTKIKIIMRSMKAFIASFKDKYEDADNIEKSLFNIIDDISKEYHKAIKDNLIDKYKEDGEYLFDYVFLEHYVPYNSHNMSYLLKVLQVLSESRINNTQKAQMFLSLVNIYLETSVLDCEKAFDVLNGTLIDLNNKHYNR